MSEPNAAGIFEKAADWLWAVFIALVGMLHRGNANRMKDIETSVKELGSEVKLKASDIELQRQRDHIESLFEKTQEIDLKVTRTAAGVDRIAADLESEKRTRADTTREVLRKLDKIMESR